MIEKEELIDALTDLMDGDLSEGAIGYIADDLMEKFVMFERPKVQVSRDGKLIRVADTRLTDTSLQYWQEHMDEAGRELTKGVEDYVTGHAVLSFYEKEQDNAKAARRDELVKEAGGGTFEELPGMLRTLVYRLVEAEFKNVRD